MIRESQNNATLESAIKSDNGLPIIVIKGNTYPIRNYLGRKGLGFNWYRSGKFWWMYKSRFDQRKDEILSKLESIGVNTSKFRAEGESQEITEEQTADEEKNVSLTDKSNNTDRYSFTSFPVNPNIYTTEIKSEYKGNPIELTVQFGRHRDEKYRKTIPLYIIKVFYEGKEVMEKRGAPPKGSKWTKAGPNYNEDELVEKVINNIHRWLDNPKSSLYNNIEYERQSEQRCDKLKEVLNILDNTYDADVSEYFPDRSIYIGEAPYTGNFNIKLEPRYYPRSRSFNINLLTNVDHKLAPRASTLARINIPVQVNTLKEVNNYIDNYIEQNNEDIKKDYLEYLKSFAFSKEQQEQFTSEMQEVIGRIVNKNIDVPFFKKELLERGLIRPSRRQKRTGPGMAPQSSFKLIIDDKAVRDASLTWKSGNPNDPDYIFAGIAYNLMRIKHGNIGFMPILLDDVYRNIASLLQRYFDADIKAREIASYIDSVARALYQDLTGKKYKSWDEVAQEFYQGFTTQQEQGNVHDFGNINIDFNSLKMMPQFLKRVMPFVMFVSGKTDLTPQQVIDNLKAAYRKFALQYHPDSTSMPDKEEAGRVFKEGTELYNNLPREVLGGNNWYSKSVRFTNG